MSFETFSRKFGKPRSALKHVGSGFQRVDASVKAGTNVFSGEFEARESVKVSRISRFGFSLFRMFVPRLMLMVANF